MIEGITYIDNFIDINIDDIKNNTIWDEKMKSRKTASYGIAYSYSGNYYENTPIPEDHIYNRCLSLLESKLNYRSNNILINYYMNNSSTMGYHSDNIDVLDDNTGVSIISLGGTRTLRFRNIIDNTIIDFELTHGSFFYMTADVQKLWKHSVLKGDGERISLTFRKMKI